MGISPFILDRFRGWKRAGYFDGSARVLELGSQELFCEQDPASLNRALRAFGVTRLPDAQAKRLAARGPAADLYRLLGFEHVAIDSDGACGALPLDLNYEALPELQPMP